MPCWKITTDWINGSSRSNLEANIKPIPGLNYQQVVGYENRQWELHQYWPSTHRSEIDNPRKGHAHMAFSKTENLTSEGYSM